MRKSIAYLVLLLLPWVARAQALADWYYWFDTDNAPRQSGKMSGLNAHLQVDASQLETGAHMLYIQVMDTAGVYSPPMGNLFVHVPDASKGSTLRYWFDGSTATYDQPYTQGQHLIDVGKLVPGFHFINYYVLDGHDIGTNVQSAGFYRTPMQSQQRLHYWFAGDSLATQVPDYQNGFTLDVTRLREGFNTIYFQVVENGPTDIESSHFIKIPQTECTGDMTVVCIIDGKVAAEQKLPNAGGVIKWNMDVSSMDVGLHKALFQVITPSGAGSSIAETYFIRTLSDADIATMQCSYAIDGYRHYSQKGTCANGTFHFDLPVNEVEDGLHRIDYMLVAENGTTTTQGSNWFYKTPLGGNRIKQYEYWLNDKSQDVHSVTLTKSQDPFQLIKLLPLTHEPIRSSCFQFEVKDDKPMMYAKNDIHFRFHDKSGRWVDADRQYVDYSVSQEVRNIKTLKNEQTFARPDSNEVKWFKFEANYGDSIALRSRQATSIQIFESSGKEIYTASGSASVNFGGCHLFENGTFYVAVHDAMGSDDDITLFVKRIDKYAIFEFTPSKMSSIGKTLMYFKGNGFDQVKSIEIFNEEITLKPDTIVATSSDMLARFTSIEQLESSKKMSLKVFFNNTEKGDSKTITLKDAITLEPASKKKISVNIVTERRVDDPFPIKVTIKNNGNIGSYGIPLNIAYDNIEKIDEFNFVNFDLILSGCIYKSKEFFTFTNNLLGKGAKGFFMPLLIPYIGPYEELTFTFGVKTKIAHAQFNFYAWTGDPWYAPSGAYSENQPSVKPGANNSPCDGSDTNIPRPQDDPENYNDPSDRPDQPYDPNSMYVPLDIIDELTDFPVSPSNVLRPHLGTAEAIAGIIQSSTRAREDATLKAYGIDASAPASDQYRFKYRYPASSPHDIWNRANPFHMPRRTPSTGNDASSSFKSTDDYASRPCPNPTPHPTDVYIPGDPNEMTGYVSASGSHYMADSIKNISYDIEFENDPKIANSSAHVITIENHLDANRFNLETFTPKSITMSGRKVELDGGQSFVKTIDLRPNINAIGELSCNYNSQKGLAKWTFTSLDPMTMEQTKDIMQGILPVNHDGTSGIGNVTYSISLKQPFPDGTEVPNKASIVFDNNEAIETPVWTNIVDAVAPESHIAGVVQMNDSTARISLDGSDNRSGVWKYEVYAQHGAGSTWVKAGECTADSGSVDFRFYGGMDYGFCVLATDSAGNVEQKELSREASLGTATKGDVNGDGKIDMVDATLIVNYYLGKPDTYLNALSADTNDDGTIDIVDAIATTKLYMESAPPAHDTPKAARRRRVMKVKNQ